MKYRLYKWNRNLTWVPYPFCITTKSFSIDKEKEDISFYYCRDTNRWLTRTDDPGEDFYFSCYDWTLITHSVCYEELKRLCLETHFELFL